MARFRWTQQSEAAASLLAQGNLSLDAIAERVGVVRKTLYSWRKNEEFKAKVEEQLNEFRAEVRRIGLGTTERRVHSQNDRWNRMRRLIEARADDPSMAHIPGGSTGLLTRKIKRVVVESDPEGGPTSREVEEYEFDAGLLKEIREIERQAAQELGQWQVKVEANVVDMRQAVGLTEAASDAYVDPDDE